MPTLTTKAALLASTDAVDFPQIVGPPTVLAPGSAPFSISVNGVPLDSLVRDLPPLPPDEFSKFLWDNFRIQRSPRRLAQLRMSGQGPPFMRDGNVVRYPPRLGSIWAIEQLGAPVRSTSEESARKLIGARAVPTPA
jgi:hypothetical protein